MTEFKKGGSAILQAKIEEAAVQGRHEVEFSGMYEMEGTVRLPSDFTLRLRDCHLRMAAGTFCNMFVNKSCRANAMPALCEADHDISIIGSGRVILDGGEYNGLCEGNSGKEGRPHISVNSLILFSNVDRFRVKNLHLRDQRWWAMNFVACRNGYIGHMDFRSDHTYMENGVRVEGMLSQDHYASICVKNSDGIDLRCGCHDIVIENITGFTEDDTVALTALNGTVEVMYGARDMEAGIHNVAIRNVNAASVCAIVRMLAQEGRVLYNILVDGVFDASADCPYVDRGGAAVRLGDEHPYGKRPCTEDEVYNIHVRNVFSRADKALWLAGKWKDCRFEDIYTF